MRSRCNTAVSPGGTSSPPFGVCATAFGMFPNAAIVEGLAVAADNPVDDLTLHEWAAGMRQQKLLPDDTAARNVTEPVYLGGPVLQPGIFAVTRQAPEGAGIVVPLMPGLFAGFQNSKSSLGIR